MDPTNRQIIVAAGLRQPTQIEAFVRATHNVRGYTTRPGYINQNGQELFYKRYYHYRPYIIYCRA